MHLFLLPLMLLGFSTHDIQLAHFGIHQQNDNLIIEFVLDYEDVLSVQEEQGIDITDEVIQEYINTNFSLSVNGTPQSISYQAMEIKGEHINLLGATSNVDKTINTLEIKNTCLLNIEGHSNIIKLRLSEKDRDFLMNEDRTSIQITF